MIRIPQLKHNLNKKNLFHMQSVVHLLNMIFGSQFVIRNEKLELIVDKYFPKSNPIEMLSKRVSN